MTQRTNKITVPSLEEILPCPFCQQECRIYENDLENFQVQCWPEPAYDLACGYSAPFSLNRAEAIRLHNSVAIMPNLLKV